MVNITIETDNAAFEDYPSVEVASILRSLADRLDVSSLDDMDGRSLMDSNGNRVGKISVAN